MHLSKGTLDGKDWVVTWPCIIHYYFKQLWYGMGVFSFVSFVFWVLVLGIVFQVWTRSSSVQGRHGILDIVFFQFAAVT